MKIIHILLGKANPNTLNGVNKVVHYLAEEQCRNSIDVEVWGITPTPEVKRYQCSYPVRLFEAHRFSFNLDRKLRKSLNELPTDSVVHMHSVFIPELYMISRILKKRGIRWILTPHGGYSPHSMKKNRINKLLYLRLFENRLIGQAHMIHAIGDSEITDIRRLAPNQRIVKIPNGVKVQDLEFSGRPLEATTGPIFGYCGRLALRHKGLDLLIDGFSCYLKNGGKGQLWLIGDGPDRKTLSKHCEELSLENAVIFHGAKFEDEKLNLLAHMDVFIHTSRWEGLPTAVLEAAALSKPLLVSKATNMAPYVQRWQCGLVLEDNTPAHIGEALKILEGKYDMGSLSESGMNARSMVDVDFQWPAIANALVESAYQSEQE